MVHHVSPFIPAALIEAEVEVGGIDGPVRQMFVLVGPLPLPMDRRVFRLHPVRFQIDPPGAGDMGKVTQIEGGVGFAELAPYRRAEKQLGTGHGPLHGVHHVQHAVRRDDGVGAQGHPLRHPGLRGWIGQLGGCDEQAKVLDRLRVERA